MYCLRFKKHLINIITAAKSAYSKLKKIQQLRFQLDHGIIPVVNFYVSVTFLNVCN